ncbi:uncharacterized protein LOC132921431 [Rhopalosiphum padi]|uniref:uncharacterized protein LOC132921431 n=1 Tax=Rhopalosiphum padi TaxID=40932 RepID=UPI00298ECF01|nr:uncharacterized protein LOC132921431 [Rhopalosiphum padi]
MVVALRIVCVLAVFCGALQAAPTVTYDQRQHGEFNLQVDVDDVAIVLLASDELAQRGILQNSNKMYQILGRRNGVKLKKKHQKKPVNCMTTTVNPEVPYSELPSSTSYLLTSSQGYDELYSTSTSSQEKLQDIIPAAAASLVFETNVPTALDSLNTTSSDSYSTVITPTPFVNSSEIEPLKTIEKPTVVGGAVETNNNTEMVAIQTIEKSTNVTSLQASDISKGSKTDVKTIGALSTNFEENPVSVSSDVKIVDKITNDKIIKVDDTPAKDSNTEDKSNEMTTVRILETIEIKEVKPAEMIVIKTMKKSTNGGPIPEEFVDESVVDASRVNVLETQVNTKITSEPTEMIAMKTIEKPTFSEVLKVVKNPMNAADAVKSADTQANKTTSVDLNKSPVELVAMKTMESPHTTVRTTTSIEKSGITISTKVVEIQEDTKMPSVENIVSRSAPKQTEMIAMKPVENSATVKSVISVKTVIKPGIQKSTLSSNSSLIMRKVGDRKPLPTITLEVATPKVL